jgi:hypothetical protein
VDAPKVSIETVGFRAGDLLEPNTFFRLTLANHWYNAPGTFPEAAKSLYSVLYQRAKVIPVTNITIANGAQVAIVDVNLKVSEYGADLINALDDSSSASDNYAFVSRIEKLNAAADATGADAVDARAKAEVDASKNTGATNEISKLFDSLSSITGAAKWIGIAVVVLALFYLASPYLSRRK